MTKKNSKEIKSKTIIKPQVAQMKRKVVDFGALLIPVKFRLFKLRYNYKDDDLITEKEFKANMMKMYGE